MKKTISLLLITFFLNLSFGQNGEEKDQLAVINILGAKVYEQPSFGSKILTELPPGKKILMEKSIDSDKMLEIGKDFLLNGNWIKPKGVKGFVFSSDLTDKQTEFRRTENGKISINLLGD